MAEHFQRRAAETIGRRDFLRTGVAAVAGTAVLGAAVSVADESPTDAKQIVKRPFGKTGRVLPILAYGGAALPQVWGNPLSTEDRVKLVRYAYDRGLRYFDTAGNYLESQSILGAGLKDVRQVIYLVTKVPTCPPLSRYAQRSANNW